MSVGCAWSRTCASWRCQLLAGKREGRNEVRTCGDRRRCGAEGRLRSGLSRKGQVWVSMIAPGTCECASARRVGRLACLPNASSSRVVLHTTTEVAPNCQARASARCRASACA
eukprot:3068601-Pleurochrysis_carterae.AAC.1